jgi:hypothetical protein
MGSSMLSCNGHLWCEFNDWVSSWFDNLMLKWLTSLIHICCITRGLVKYNMPKQDWTNYSKGLTRTPLYFFGFIPYVGQGQIIKWKLHIMLIFIELTQQWNNKFCTQKVFIPNSISFAHGCRCFDSIKMSSTNFLYDLINITIIRFGLKVCVFIFQKQFCPCTLNLTLVGCQGSVWSSSHL